MKAIGLMSGTSMDGVDVALLDTDGETITSFGPEATYAYDQHEQHLLREALESARSIQRRNDRSGVLAIAEQMITIKHVTAVKTFTLDQGIDLSSVDVIGFHGQTVIHRPEKALTAQLGDGIKLQSELNRPVVYDFRAADMEAGGQGAPFVPIFHRALALHLALPLPVAFVNIGGISNVTYVPAGPADGMVAFDVGPGNCLLDDWAMLHTGQPLDCDAKLALAGQINTNALMQLIADPFFKMRPPKSLDRNDFSMTPVKHLTAEDGAATLTAFTVAGIAGAARFMPEKPKMWVISGGGTKNPHMMEGMRRLFNVPVVVAKEAGLTSDLIEAQAFAYLAVRSLTSKPISFPGTTGTRKPTNGGVVLNNHDLFSSAFESQRDVA